MDPAGLIQIVVPLCDRRDVLVVVPPGVTTLRAVQMEKRDALHTSVGDESASQPADTPFKCLQFHSIKGERKRFVNS